MPRYTFECERCGSYDRWKRMTDDLANDNCPECGIETSRIYESFHTNILDTKVSKRIEQGVTPKTVKRQDLPKNNIRQNEKNPRPWMM